MTYADRKTWIYSFLILLLVSVWVLSLRLLNIPFLALDFELALVYLPTVLAGIIVYYLTNSKRRH